MALDIAVILFNSSSSSLYKLYELSRRQRTSRHRSSGVWHHVPRLCCGDLVGAPRTMYALSEVFISHSAYSMPSVIPLLHTNIVRVLH